jgi:hypothetical protein
LTFSPGCGILEPEAAVIDKAVKPAFVQYLLLGLVAVLVVYVGTGFVRQTQVRDQQRAELERIENQILLAQQEAAILEKHLEFVESPAAVEAWALENGWARPDEMPVVLVGPTGEPARSRTPGRSQAGLPTPQHAWWELFFGDR